MKTNNYKKEPGSSFTVHDLPSKERPRERLKNHGAEKLSDSELIAILLRTGSRENNVLVTAQKLLSKFGSLYGLSKASLEEIQKGARGIGPDKAVTLLAAFRIAQLINNSEKEVVENRIKEKTITEPENAADLLRQKFDDWSVESFKIASFDSRNRLIAVDNISNGMLTASIVHPRETFHAAIRRHAAAIIVSHNHPSGDPAPSEEDIKITRRLADAGKIMGISLLDHIIITQTSFYSFKQNGMI